MKDYGVNNLEHEGNSSTHFMPATPSTRFLAVIVPVLSKQQASTLPAKGIWKGSVQKMAHFCIATKLALTAKLSSIDYSGGTKLVMIIMQSRSLLFLRPRVIPFIHTYQLAAIAKMRRNPMKRKDSRLLALTLSVLESIVRTSWPCAVPKPVRRMTARRPLSGVHAGSPGLDCRTLVPPNSTAILCALSTSRQASASHGSIDSFRRGVDSPENMASSSIHAPRTSSKSAGTVVFWCARRTMVCILI